MHASTRVLRPTILPTLDPAEPHGPDDAASDHALAPPADDRRATQRLMWMGAGMILEVTAFWLIVGLIATLVCVLYIVPAQRRLAVQRDAAVDAEARLERAKAENERLEAESASLDDPYYIERLLREDYYWQPKERLDRYNRPRRD